MGTLFEDMELYARLYGLVRNRIDMVNENLGHRRDGHGVPCMVVDGMPCSLLMWGRTVCTWRLYDLAGIERVLDVVSVLDHFVWDARRMGYVVGVEDVKVNANMALAV